MERLTIRNDNLGLEEISFVNPNDPEGMYNILDLAKRSENGNGAESGVLLDISTKLAAYEDTGLEPEEVSKLKADYARLNDFEQSQILALMQKNSELEAKIKDLKALVAPRLPY